MSASFRPSFWEELRRRRVVRAIAVYGIVAWVVVQVADVFFPALRMPDWTVTLVAVLAVVGFPVTVGVAWVFDRTPEGLQRTEPVDGEVPSAGGDSHHPDVSGPTRTATPAHKLDRRLLSALALGVLVGVVVVGAGFWITGRLHGLGEPERPATASGEGKGAVAVLPFETKGEANPTFTDGIHSDVLTRLSGVSGLDVIARSSVLRYRGGERSAREIADELGAGWILGGEVHQVGDRVRVFARLVDAPRDRQVWAEAYSRELTAANLFEIQRQITRQIVAALETQLTPRELAAVQRPVTENLDAWRLYNQGRGLLVDRTEERMRRAAAFFGQAIDMDPDYAAAWAGLADALVYLETFGYPLPTESMDAERVAERALELDPELAEAHFALANLAHARRNNGEAIRRAERAIALRPSYSDAYNLLSWIHKQHGRPDAALETANRAVDLNPLGPAFLSNLSLAYLAMGEEDNAAREAMRIRELSPEFTTGAFLEALARYHQGRYQEAAALVDGLEVAWTPAGPDALRALSAVALGNTAAARPTLAALEREGHAFSAALVRAALGETDAAVDAIARIDRWDYWSTFAVRYFFPEVLAPLRSDPRYESILRGVDGSWGAPGVSRAVGLSFARGRDDGHRIQMVNELPTPEPSPRALLSAPAYASALSASVGSIRSARIVGIRAARRHTPAITTR